MYMYACNATLEYTGTKAEIDSHTPIRFSSTIVWLHRYTRRTAPLPVGSMGAMGPGVPIKFF